MTNIFHELEFYLGKYSPFMEQKVGDKILHN